MASFTNSSWYRLDSEHVFACKENRHIRHFNQNVTWVKTLEYMLRAFVRMYTYYKHYYNVCCGINEMLNTYLTNITENKRHKNII